MGKKKCRDCQEEKPIEQFHRRESASDRLQTYCKQCYIIRRCCSMYKISKEEYIFLRNRSDDACEICFDDEVALSLDHDHETGTCRGFLCQSCNLGLGQFQDSITTLKSAIEYLERE